MACFTRHPLLALLQSKVGRKPVVGMFEATVTTALHLLPSGSKFAVVTTTSSYIQHLTEAVKYVLGISTGKDSIFAGVVASGITWDILLNEPKEVAKMKLIEIVRELVKDGDIGVVCLGGAILVGMVDWVQEACILELGEEMGRSVRIVDQLLAGVTTLDGLVRIGLCSRF